MTFAKYPVTGGGGTGDVVGPASSTDNALAVWDGATGKLLKNSSVLVGNVVAGPASATDSAVVLFDGTTGKLVKNSTLSASTIVLTSGNQTVGGTKTFSSQLLAPTVNFTNSSNQMVFGSGTFKTTISVPGAPAADLTYTFPNIQAVSLTGTVSLLEAANQTFSGSGTIFSQTVRFDSSSPIFLGAFPNRIALSPGSQASPRTWLFPDLTVDPTFAALEGTQSFSGNKTFSGTLTVPATVSFTGLNSITKAGNFAHTLTTTATSNSTFPSGTQTLAALDLGQTWSAIQTHSAAIAFTGGTAANLSVWAASNVLRQRGGTSGWAVDNTSGTAILSATDAGAWTLGPAASTNLNLAVNGRASVTHGLTFPATANLSADVNTLDDYEEGTWTPVLDFAIPGTAATYGANRYGHYQKIGNRVYFHCYVVLATKGTGTGTVLITGLPFTPVAISSGGISCCSVWTSGISRTNYQITAYVDAPLARIQFGGTPINADAGAAVNIDNTHVSGTASLMVTGFYITAS